MIIKYNNNSYDIIKSKRKNKKYDVYGLGEQGFTDYLLSFGDSRYEQYYDKIGEFKHKNHNNDKRRESYYKRHGKESKPLTAKWFSHNLLW